MKEVPGRGLGFAELLAGLEGPAGVPGANGPGGHAFGHDRACPDNAPFLDGNAGVNEGLGRNPDVVADNDGAGNQRKTGLVIVMRSCN